MDLRKLTAEMIHNSVDQHLYLLLDETMAFRMNLSEEHDTKKNTVKR